MVDIFNAGEYRTQVTPMTAIELVLLIGRCGVEYPGQLNIIIDALLSLVDETYSKTYETTAEQTLFNTMRSVFANSSTIIK
jgi:hypothetical protein